MTLPLALIPWIEQRFLLGRELVSSEHDRRVDDAFAAPSESMPLPDHPICYAEFARPFADGLGATVNGDPDVVATIVHLRNPISPSAILRRVRAIIVDAIKGVIWRGLTTHISQEVLVTRQPPFANGDSPSAIVLKPDISRIKASPFHACPRVIFNALGIAMRAVSRACEFGGSTAATLRVAAAQIARRGDAFISTVATAQPARVMAGFGVLFNDEIATEALACKVYFLRHIVRITQ